MTASVTLLLEAHRAGDESALDELATRLYPELKAMAQRRTAGNTGHGATTLVNETFLKLLGGGHLAPRDRREFFALTATVMRRVIVDEVRYLAANKRARSDVTLAETLIGDDSHEKAAFLLEVDEITRIIEAEDARLARVFECRYFAGFTVDETSEALDIPGRTVERLWSDARSRIAELLEQDSAGLTP